MTDSELQIFIFFFLFLPLQQEKFRAVCQVNEAYRQQWYSNFA